MNFVLLNDLPGAQWAWELRSRETDALFARSTQRYADRAEAMASIEAVQRGASAAPAYDDTGRLLELGR